MMERVLDEGWTGQGSQSSRPWRGYRAMPDTYATEPDMNLRPRIRPQRAQVGLRARCPLYLFGTSAPAPNRKDAPDGPARLLFTW
jgi:hypothetical protein